MGKVENIILSALKNNNLTRCASLFSLYQNQIIEGKVSKFLLSSSDDEKDKKPDDKKPGDTKTETKPETKKEPTKK